MSKSNPTEYLSEVRVCVSPMVYVIRLCHASLNRRHLYCRPYIKRKYIPTHETAPLFLYKPIKLATYSYHLIV